MAQEYLQTTIDKFIFRVKVGPLYSEAGVWADWDESRGTARLGLTDFRQQVSGDIAFVELPRVGTKVAAGDELAGIETVKVDLDVPAPFDGEVVSINAGLKDEPELINQDPYGKGWLVESKLTEWPPAGLLDAATYLQLMTQQAEAEAKK